VRFEPFCAHFAFSGLAAKTVVSGEWSSFPPCAAEFSLIV
jgi:hypothetical protein